MFNLDTSITPNNDFYHHVNMNWISTNTIPDDNMIWNVFHELNESNLLKIKKMLTDNSEKEYDKVIVLYKQSNDLINTKNNTYKPYITKILDVDCRDIETLRHTIIDLFTLGGITHVNNFYVSNDFNDSNRNILHIGTGGLGLPDRDYYFNDNKKDIRDKYMVFMKEYLAYFNLDFNCSTIYNIEKKLAEYTYTNVEKRDSTLMNNPVNIRIIETINPDLADDLKYYFNRIGNKPLYEIGKINITNPRFTKAYYELLKIYSLDDWKQYFVYLFLRKMGNYIDINTETMLFNFYGKVLSGTKIIKEQYKRSIETLNNNVGMLLGKMFVAKYFDEKSKIKATEMILFIKQELKERLENNTWMEKETKIRALDKLNKMNFKVGYPDKWRDYTKLNVSSNNSFFVNILNCNKFDYYYELEYLYKPIDRTNWFMNPHEINAYYSPSYNEIVFPSGILMQPFFSIEQDVACNFGGIGCIIGHEITHGFDDMGRKFDGDGNLNDWWTENDIQKYKVKSDILKQLFNRLKIGDDTINGELTLGENIADLGGVEIAFNSLKKYYMKYPNELKPTSFQHFFFNYANIWRYKIREEEAVKRLTTDPHSPPKYRVNTILSNVNDFYNYFAITKGSPMWIEPIERASIW